MIPPMCVSLLKFSWLQKAPAPSQCYSEFEDITEQIIGIDRKGVPLFYRYALHTPTLLAVEELRQMETVVTAESIPLNPTSLGKRRAGNVSDDLGPPESKKPRMTSGPEEELQAPLPVGAETSLSTEDSSCPEIPFIIVRKFTGSGHVCWHVMLKPSQRRTRVFFRNALMLGILAAVFSGRLPDLLPFRIIRMTSLPYPLIF